MRGMHAGISAAKNFLLREWAQRMQRESYERAGREARGMGIRRADNPFVRPTDKAFAAADDPQRRQALATYWWCGWDSAGPTPGKRGRPLKTAAD
jgi:hypothetical protein